MDLVSIENPKISMAEHLSVNLETIGFGDISGLRLSGDPFLNDNL